jgi:ligand-binding sensor domain-containing protein
MDNLRKCSVHNLDRDAWRLVFALTWLLLSLPLGPAHSQARTWTALTSMLHVEALAVADGIVFGATAGGVLRYDPETGRYTRFTRADGLAGNHVLSILLDSTGDLWFGTEGTGLSRLRTGEARFDDPVRALDGLTINCMTAVEDRLFVGTEIGISVLLKTSGRIKETYRQLGSFPRDTGVVALEVHDGLLWAATTAGVASAPLDDTNLQDPDRWISSDIMGETSSLLALTDTLFSGGAAAVWRFDDQQAAWIPMGAFGKIDALGSFGPGPELVAVVAGAVLERQPAGNWVRNRDVDEVLSVSRGGENLWLGVETGLAVIGLDQPPPIRNTPSNQFFDIELGSNGQLWVASMANDREGQPEGVYHYDGVDWEVHNRTQGLPSDFAVSVVRDEMEHLWVATWGRGVGVFDNEGTWHTLDQRNSVLRGITLPPDPLFVVVSDIQRDDAGLMWMTNVQAGLAVMDGYPPRRGLLHGLAALGLPAGAHIGRVAIGPQGLKWVATSKEGLVLFDDGGTPFGPADDAAFVVHTSTEPRLRSNNITAVAVTPDNVMWVGTDNGLYRLTVDYDREAGRLMFSSWREYRLEHGLSSSFITAITFDDQDNVWVGSRVGLTWLRATGGLVTTFTTGNSGLVEDRVEALTYDAATGSLWIGTFGGLARLQVGLDRGAASVRQGPVVYPNPWVIGGSRDVSRLTISGLPLDSIVSVFSLDGGLIRFLEADPGTTVIHWDGTNRDGEIVGSGIFMYAATTKSGRVIRGKFALVRAG